MKPVKAVVKIWAEKTTCHGVADLVHTRSRVVKIMWLLIIGFSLLFMGLQISELFINFWERRWETMVYEESAEGGLLFAFIQISESQNKAFSGGLKNPTITICNTNRIRQTKATEYGLTPDMLALLFENSHAPYSFVKTWGGEHRANITAEFFKWRMEHNFTSTWDIYRALSHQCRDMFLTVVLPSSVGFADIDQLCSYNNGSMNSARFVPIMTTLYGMCQRLILDDSVDFDPPGKIGTFYVSDHSICISKQTSSQFHTPWSVYRICAYTTGLSIKGLTTTTLG